MFITIKKIKKLKKISLDDNMVAVVMAVCGTKNSCDTHTHTHTQTHTPQRLHQQGCSQYQKTNMEEKTPTRAEKETYYAVGIPEPSTRLFAHRSISVSEVLLHTPTLKSLHPAYIYHTQKSHYLKGALIKLKFSEVSALVHLLNLHQVTI